MHGPTVLTVVLNWRTPAMTLEAVAAAVREMRGIAGGIVVVDNASGDGSVKAIRDGIAAGGWDRARVVAAERNGGYGAGNNVGIRAGLSDGSTPDYVYILNSDAFPDAGAIRALLAELEAHPDTGFAGSYTHGPDGEPHMTAFRFPSLLGEVEGAARLGPVTRLLRRHVIPIPLPQARAEVDWLAGASVMMRRTMLDAIGLFDEGFFLYYDETDLCRRGHAAGWRCVYVRDSAVTHLGSASTGMKTWVRTPQYWFDSRLRYFTKHHGAAYAAASTAALVAAKLMWRLRARLQGLPPCDPPHFLGDLLAHGFRSPQPSRRPAAGGGEPERTVA
jgi:N-acetylglucosaminyl-diphospho-decaprenol L-rhamnosyltransferase